MTNKALEQYLKELKKALCCPQPERSRLLPQSKALLENFLEENPEADYEAFVTAFGPPEVFAGEMLDTLDRETLKCAQFRRKWVHGGVVALAAVVMLALCMTFWPAQPDEPEDDNTQPYFQVVEDHDDPTHKTIYFNLPPEVVNSLLHPEQSSEP